MQTPSQQYEIPRGQSFNYDSNRPFIYYYSVAKPLPDYIIDDLITSSQIKKVLLKQLPKVWFVMASSAVYAIVDKKQKFVTQNFILDMFIYSWLSNKQENFKRELFNRLNKLNVEQEKLERLIDIFSQEIVQIIQDIKQNFKSNYSITYNNSCVQPLIVFREKGKNENQSMIKRIDDLNCDDEVNDSTLSSSQISLALSHKDVDRSKSDVRDVTVSLQLNKMRKFTKQMEKMTENIFEQLIQYNSENQQWQVARQFVVIILETSIQSEHYMKTSEKVRFIQPALLFYKKAIQVWVLAQFSQQTKMSFSQFLCKARSFMGEIWNEKLVIPLHTVYLVAQQVYSQLQKEEDIVQQMTKFAIQMKDKLVALWDQNLSQCTKELIQQ